MKFLVYEHISAGGFREAGMPLSVLSEGFGMLRTAVEDAHQAGHTVITILDKVIHQVNPPLAAEREIAVSSIHDAESALLEIAEACDATYVIAPETNHKLQILVQEMERKTQSLNCISTAIAEASDKSRLQQYTNKLGLTTPKTIAFTQKDEPTEIIEKIADQIGFPVVLKPTQSVGCEGLSVVRNEEQAKIGLHRLFRTSNPRFLAQELVQGKDASVTLFTNGTSATPIALNEQSITIKPQNTKATYNGGTTPLKTKWKTAAFKAAKTLVESINGLQGYVGVDLVLTKKGPAVIEVNPRLTTSYIGIRKIVDFNLMQTMVNVVLNHQLPTKYETTGFACFQKVKTQTPASQTFRQALTLPEIASPPFPINHNRFTYAFLCTQGTTPQNARFNFNKAEKQLRAIIAGGARKR